MTSPTRAPHRHTSAVDTEELKIYPADAPYPEIEQIWTRDDAITIVGTLHDPQPDPGASCELSLVPRDVDHPGLTYPVTLDGARFTVTCPVQELAAGSPPGKGCWDLYLVTTAGGEPRRIRVGRHLDDVEKKTKILVYPRQEAVAGDEIVTVKPRYTIKNNVSIDYSRRASAES